MTWTLSKALMQAYVSSHFSPEQAGESSGPSSSVGRQFAQSNGNPTRQAYLSPGKTTESSPPSLSGMTCKHLTADLGADVLTWYLEAFLAKTSAAPARAPALAVAVRDYGVRWRALSMRYDPASFTLKTPHFSLVEDSTSSSLTLPRWGLMRDGELWERVTLTRLTNETAYGSLPTPVKYDSHGTWESNNYHGLGWKAKHEWAKTLVGDQPTADDEPIVSRRPRKIYPTPIKADSSVGKNLLTLQKIENGEAFDMLARAVRREEMEAAGTFFSDAGAVSGVTERTVRIWPTPVKNEDRAAAYTFDTSRRHFLTGSNQVHLAQAARDPLMHPTPIAKDARSVRSVDDIERRSDRRGGAGFNPSLAETTRLAEVRLYPTPVSNEKSGKLPPKEGFTHTASGGVRRNSVTGTQVNLAQVANAVSGKNELPTPTAVNGLRSDASSEHFPGKWQSPGHPEYGELNPEWVEWIMGWPIGWTSLAPMTHEAFDMWFAMTSADPATGRNVWWVEDPSDIPEAGIPKTIKPADKRSEEVRVSRIAALGNGQVSAACAGGFTFLDNLTEPPLRSQS